jgi:hypothetical protein
MDKAGEVKASLEVFVTEVKFLSQRSEVAQAPASPSLPSSFAEQKAAAVDAQFTEITDGDLLF